MKKLIITISFISISTFCTAQIMIDSIKGFWNGYVIDSIYLQYTSHIPHIDTLVRPLSQGISGLNLSFVGCSTLLAVKKDTMLRLDSFTSFAVPPSHGLNFRIWWDTSSFCNSPSSPTLIGGRILFPTITSIEELEKLENKISIYPNPVRDYFVINIQEDIQINQVELIDLQGRLVKNYQRNKTKLAVNEIASGVYFVRVNTSLGVAVKKLLIY